MTNAFSISQNCLRLPLSALLRLRFHSIFSFTVLLVLLQFSNDSIFVLNSFQIFVLRLCCCSPISIGYYTIVNIILSFENLISPKHIHPLFQFLLRSISWILLIHLLLFSIGSFTYSSFKSFNFFWFCASIYFCSFNYHIIFPFLSTSFCNLFFRKAFS